jgi:hypothetical protein
MDHLIYGQFADGLNRFAAVIKQNFADPTAQRDIIEQ